MKILAYESEAFAEAWSYLWGKDSFQHALYTPKQAAYYDAYRESVHFENASFVVIYKEKPVCGMLLTLERSDSKLELSYYGLPILYLCDVSSDMAHSQLLYKLVRDYLASLIGEGNEVNVVFREPEDHAELSAPGRYFLESGGAFNTHVTQMIDLAQDTATLRKGLRKSYKSLVSWGEKNLNMLVADRESVDSSLISSFRELHVMVAGKETRSKETWAAQQQMIEAGEAFAIFAWMDKKLVSAALFPHSNRYCFYGVSASDRSLFDKPLSHAVLWKAIHYAKEIGCRHFEMGEQCYYLSPDASEQARKEYNISKFKRGFGGYPKIVTDIVIRTTKAACFS